MLENIRGGGIAVLAASVLPSCLISNTLNSKISESQVTNNNSPFSESVNTTGYIPVSSLFSGDNISGNLLYYTGEDNTISIEPTETYEEWAGSQGDNLVLKTNVYDGYKINISAKWGLNIQSEGLNVGGSLDISAATYMTEIKDMTFAGTPETSLVLPSTITTIGESALLGSEITSVTFNTENAPSWMSGINSLWLQDLDNYPTYPTKVTTFYVPADKLDAYNAYVSTSKPSWFLDTMHFEAIPDPSPSPTNSNLGLILGLSLGLGVPVLAGVITGIAVGVKKHQNKGKKK